MTDRTMTMTDTRSVIEQDRRERLDDLLSRWHWWRAGYKFASGGGSGGQATSGYRTSRQYDDENGALDHAIETGIMKQLDAEVDQLRDIHRAAICSIARALCLGVTVFHSPRIPPERRAMVELEARAALTVRLLAAGLLEA